MSPGKRMQPVAEVVQQRADDAARSFAESRHQLEQKQAQLDELLGYRSEYTQKLQSLGELGLNAFQIRDYNLFMARLNQAIEQQVNALEHARIEVDMRRQNWLEKDRRARAIDKAIDRFETQEQNERTRREQNESDEHARTLAGRYRT